MNESLTRGIYRYFRVDVFDTLRCPIRGYRSEHSGLLRQVNSMEL